MIVVMTDRGEVLLQHRDDKKGICWPGYWSVPGGGREPGETPGEAAFRELKEETGISLDSLQQVTVTDYDPAPANPPHVFLGIWNGHESDLVLGEGQALAFVPVDALPAKMPPHIRHYVTQIASGAYSTDAFGRGHP
ncbi:NUDIX domain-containing protein [Streptomyces sp. MS19]|uniref:NUDIX domain-containing protein n=1 Tax=Streptomyces sp. MS19 TaxID=3385972 RepID=UPI0039A19449